MKDAIEIVEYRQPTTYTWRDLAAVLFRHPRLLLISFFGVLLGAIASGALAPSYKGEMKFLVRRERIDPVVTSRPDATPPVVQEEISQSELNSEVELLNSNDLLRQVVIATGLDKKETRSRFSLSKPSEELAVEKAIRRLAKSLKAQPLPKTNVISVSYAAGNPELADRVLNEVARLYLQKHLQAHRPSGEFAFFDQETAHLRDDLGKAEARLADFTRKKGVVSAPLERDLTLQRASDLEASLTQTMAAMANTEQRIRTLEEQLTALPTRVVTQVRHADNPQLMQQLKSTLLTLELKRTELLAKYDAHYRPVVEVEKQIRETHAAIEAEAKSPIRDETTDRDTTYEWVQSELVKARTELSGLQAQASAGRTALARFQQTSRNLQQASLMQQDLLRTAKTQEENYLLYQRKQEEARINDALDRRGILNVALAEAPAVPVLPARSAWFYGILSVLLAGTASVGAVFTADFLDCTFRTPDEVTTYLESPVLAFLPENRE